TSAQWADLTLANQALGSRLCALYTGRELRRGASLTSRESFLAGISEKHQRQHQQGELPVQTPRTGGQPCRQCRAHYVIGNNHARLVPACFTLRERINVTSQSYWA